MSKVKDPSLAPQGQLKIDWAVCTCLCSKASDPASRKRNHFKGFRSAMCMHLEMKTAVLGQTIQAGGASVAITGSNPLSTQDDVAAALAKSGVNVYAWNGVTPEEHHANLLQVLSHKPQSHSR